MDSIVTELSAKRTLTVGKVQRLGSSPSVCRIIYTRISFIEDMNLEGGLKYYSRGGIVIAGLIIYLLLWLMYAFPPFKSVWDSGHNYIYYEFLSSLVMGVIMLIGAYVVLRLGIKLLQFEWRGFGIFAFGALLLFFIPFGNAQGILPGGNDLFGPIQVILLIIGIGICAAGIVALARTGGFFTIWFIGVGLYVAMGIYDVSRLSYSSDLGSYHIFVVIEALCIMIASFLLYIYCEAKFFYLSYLVDEALKHTKVKNYLRSEVLLKKALMIYPYYSTAVNNLGNVYFRMKEYKKAKECYDLVIAVDPDYKKAQINLNLAKRRVGKKMTG